MAAKYLFDVCWHPFATSVRNLESYCGVFDTALFALISGEKTFLFAEATSRPRLGHPIFGEMVWLRQHVYIRKCSPSSTTWLDTNCDRRNGLCCPHRCLLLASCALVIYTSVLQNSFPFVFCYKNLKLRWYFVCTYFGKMTQWNRSEPFCVM
jgi:hypothetical protein